MNIRGFFGQLSLLATLAIAGCGGGGGTAPATAPAPAQTSVVSGVASKGPIKAGTGKIYAIRNGVEDRSAPIGQGVTDATGGYLVDVGSYTGPVLVEVTGGSYTDEVSAATVTLKSPLRAIISNVATGTKTVAVTPLTELAYNKALGGGSLSAASIDDANGKIAAFYKLTDIISTLPIAGGAGEDQKKYAFVLGSFAQFINDNKNAGETLDDALPRLLTQISTEVKNDGNFSITTITRLNSAISGFTVGGKNLTGAAITPIVPPTSGVLKLATSGTANTIGAIDVTVDLPAGIKVAADPVSGEAAAGVVAISGAANVGDGKLTLSRFTPAGSGTPAQLHIIVINAAGFGPGEFVTIRFELDTGGSFPLSATAFTLSGFSPVGLNGTALGGITAAPAAIVTGSL